MPQVGADHYGFAIVKPPRFQLYYHVLKSILDLGQSTALEIGIGMGLVSHVLRFNGMDVRTADFDPALSPDIVCDIRELPIDDEQFDVVLASEVLEHIPWEDVPKALQEMCRVTKEYAVVSVPYNQHSIELYGNLNIVKYLYFRGLINRLLSHLFPCRFYVGIPRWMTTHKFNGEHYWEIGYRGYSVRQVRDIVTMHFAIEKEFRVPLDPYHYIFVLRKRKTPKSTANYARDAG